MSDMSKTIKIAEFKRSIAVEGIARRPLITIILTPIGFSEQELIRGEYTLSIRDNTIHMTYEVDDILVKDSKSIIMDQVLLALGEEHKNMELYSDPNIIQYTVNDIENVYLKMDGVKIAPPYINYIIENG